MNPWDGRYQSGDTPWDRGEAAPPLLELIGRNLMDPPWGGGPVLAPGCGLGHDVRAIAATGVAVTGLDLSPTAIRQAGEFPRIGREDYLVADLFETSWRPADGYAAWWEHTCFCAIDPEDRPRYARAAAELIRPGGWLCGVFFLTPWDPGEQEQGPPFSATVEEITGLLDVWFTLEIAWVPELAYPGREGREWLAVFRRKGV